MKAVGRIAIGIAVLALLLVGAGFIHGITEIWLHAMPASGADLREALFALCVAASAIFSLAFIVAPVFRRRRGGAERSAQHAGERPWRLVLVLLGADFVLLLAALPYALLHAAIFGVALAPGADRPLAAELLRLVDIISPAIAAGAWLLYVAYPFPRRLRRRP